MTALTTLFGCAAAHITLDSVRSFVDDGLPGGLTLDYKEQCTSKLVETVAAMANTYGGIVLVGVSDKPPRALREVPQAEATRVANGCHDTLEPP